MWRARSEPAIAAMGARCPPSAPRTPRSAEGRKPRPSRPFHYGNAPPGPSLLKLSTTTLAHRR
eukprot:6168736-Prymnesium_polylepis.2